MNPTAKTRAHDPLAFGRAQNNPDGLAHAFLVLGEIVQQRTDIHRLLARWPRPCRWSAYFALIAAIALVSVSRNNEFIYFL